MSIFFLALVLAIPILLIVPLLCHILAYKHDWLVTGVLCLISFVINISMMLGGTYYNARDVEILNGKITSKKMDRVSCSHSYFCRCRSVYNSSTKTSHQECDTCYEHFNDYDWNVKSTVGNFTINRVDRQGLIAPQRWQQVVIGEPAAVEHTYMNWIKASQQSVLNRDGERLKAFKVPVRPETNDYYRVVHVVLDNVSIHPSFVELNKQLTLWLAENGERKQINVMYVLTNNPDREYARAVLHSWGQKKNELLVVIGVDKTEIKWVNVSSMSSDDLVNVKTRDAILELKTIENLNTFMPMQAEIIEKHFKRKHMSDYEYLKEELEVPTWAYIVAGIIQILLSLVGMCYLRKGN